MKSEIDELESQWTDIKVSQELDSGDPHNCKKRNSTWRVWDKLIHRGGYIKEWRSYEKFYEDMGEKPLGAVLKKRHNFLPHGTHNSYWFKKELT